MAGLNQFTRLVPAGETSKIAFAGNLVVITAGGPIDVEVRPADTSQGADTTRITMTEGDKLDQVTYTQINLINTGATPETIVLLAGFGDFDRAGGGSTVSTLHEAQNSINLALTPPLHIIPQNTARKCLAFGIEYQDEVMSSDSSVRFQGEGQVAVTGGLQMQPGDIYFMDFTGGLQFANAGGAAKTLVWAEFL